MKETERSEACKPSYILDTRQLFGLVNGFSDHTLEHATAFSELSASTQETHVTYEHSGEFEGWAFSVTQQQ